MAQRRGDVVDVRFRAPFDFISLLPGGAAWAAHFYDWPGHDTSIYVNVTTVPEWPDPGTVTMDLDLEEHQVALHYPADIVALARRSADTVLSAIGAGVEPFLSVGHEQLRLARAGQVPAGELTWD